MKPIDEEFYKEWIDENMTPFMRKLVHELEQAYADSIARNEKGPEGPNSEQ